MRPSASDVERTALRLSAKQRARIALRLLSSLEPTEGTRAEIDAAWAAEAERRAQEIDDGVATPIPAAEAIASVRRSLGKRRV